MVVGVHGLGLDGRRSTTSTVERKKLEDTTCTCDRQTNGINFIQFVWLSLNPPAHDTRPATCTCDRQTNGINFIKFVWPSLNPPAHDTPIPDFFPPSAVNNLLPPGGLAHACTRSITQSSEYDMQLIFISYFIIIDPPPNQSLNRAHDGDETVGGDDPRHRHQ